MHHPNITAFFDFDNTLLAGDSAEIGIKYLVKKKKISIRRALWIWFVSRFYKVNLLSVQRMCDVTILLYRGHRLSEFIEGSRTFYLDELKPRLAPKILELLEFHRNEGHRLVLLSASLDYILHDVVRDLGFDHLQCSRLEEDKDGLLTGRIDGRLCAGEMKAEAARLLAEELGIDLARSYAYGDHHSDIPILSLVGHPVAVEPTPRLRTHARKHNWPIIGYF